MTKIPIGLQLYSVRDEAAKDLPGVLAAVAKMGYAGVEFAGYYGHAPQDIRKMLDDNGLKCFGTHTHIDLLSSEKFDSTVETHKALGTDFIIVPSLPGHYTDSKDAWRRAAAAMNEIAAKLKPLGLQTGYHNHHTEFLPMDGELPWDIFFGNTTSDVIMQFDTGNAKHGNADAGPFLRKYPGRALTVHLKDFRRKTKRLSAMAKSPGLKYSNSAKPSVERATTSWSRRVTPTRRWNVWIAVCKTCGKWANNLFCFLLHSPTVKYVTPAPYTLCYYEHSGTISLFRANIRYQAHPRERFQDGRR